MGRRADKVVSFFTTSQSSDGDGSNGHSKQFPATLRPHGGSRLRSDKGRRDRQETSAEPPDPKEVLMQKSREFNDKVRKKIMDPNILGSRQGQDASVYLEDIISLSFEVHNEITRKLMRNVIEEDLGRLVNELRREIEDLNRDHDEKITLKKKEHASDLREVISNHHQALMRIKLANKEEVDSRQKQYDWYMGQRDITEHNLKSQHEENIVELKSKHEDDIGELNLRHEAEIGELNGRLRATRTKMEVMEENHVRQTEELESAHAGEIKNLLRKLTDQKANQEEIIGILKQDHIEDLSELQKKQRTEVEELTAQHITSSDSLRKEVRGLKKVLLTRDDDQFTARMLSDAGTPEHPDERIKAMFVEVQQIGDSLSRLVWKPEQKVWTNQILDMANPNQNQRLLKKHILHDSIWCILHLYIFCSPFRVFGDEGRALEDEWAQWSKKCGQGFSREPEFSSSTYTWPALSVEVERWRYITVRECRKALEEGISRVDPRAKIKEGFRDNIGILKAEMKSLLRHMVECTDADLQKVDLLVGKLAIVWLEYQMHRCRFVLFMAGTNSLLAAEKVRRAEEGTLELTIMPGLKRYGDVTGAELGSSAIVGGFRGEFIKWPS